MKILINNKVYVQRKDLKEAVTLDVDNIPSSITDELLLSITPENRNDFICFSDAETINYFMNKNWCIDYMDVKDLSTSSLVGISQDYLDDSIKIKNIYLKTSEDEIEKRKILERKYYELDYMINSVSSLYRLRTDKTDFYFPDEIEYLKEKTKKDNFIKKLVKKVK